MADLAITPANVLAGLNSVKKTGTAGAAITAGQLLYKDKTDNGKMKLADANVEAASVVAGMALHAAAVGQPITYVTEDNDLTLGAAVTIGNVLVLSTTAGGVAPVADLASGAFPTVIAVAKSATKVVFRPLAGGVVIP